MIKQNPPSEPTLMPPKASPYGSKKRARSGMTMVETLVALTLLAVFTSGACKLLLTHRKVSDMARAHYTAINIAKNRMELVRTFDYGQVNNFLETDVIVDTSGVPDTEGNYRRTTAVNPVSGNLLELVVTVDLRNRKTLVFNPANEVLTTYFANYLEPGGGTAPATPGP
jgi:prepilin-type N-terminal cleavage/methylation domain-containing protein